ncbi:hypothetical protein LXA43DRAFT_905388 [Ganoderma leucocontextum]|nr:hypothetical protein LXA43DRAFT_905388 [Ganoderma leucocontextum]
MAQQRSRARCKGHGAAGTPCGALVSCTSALPFPRGGRLPFYCHRHLQALLARPTMSCKWATCAVRFKDFIPSHLELRTQVLLRHFMRGPPLRTDKPGYVYALKLVDTAHPDLVRIKVGRTADVARRLYQHRSRCPSFNPFLLGYYPSKTQKIYSRPVPFADLLERLVHLELTELAARSYPAGKTATRPRCQDCGSVHVEIFTFKRVPGMPDNYEWEHIVRPVFQRWGRFVSNHVA